MIRLAALSSILTALIYGGMILGPDAPEETKSSAMATAAQEWLDSLGNKQRAAAVFPFDGKERKNWHFVPKTRKGIESPT